MTRRALTVLAPLVLAASLQTAAQGAEPAPNKTPGCVDYHEFRTVPYEHKSLVERDFDAGTGQLHVDPSMEKKHWVQWTYPTCVEGAQLIVFYRKSTWQSQGYMWIGDRR